MKKKEQKPRKERISKPSLDDDETSSSSSTYSLMPEVLFKGKDMKISLLIFFQRKGSTKCSKIRKKWKKFRKSPYIFNLYKLILCDMFLYQKIPNFLPILWSLWPLEEVCGKVLELLLLLAAVLKFITSPTFHCFS